MPCGRAGSAPDTPGWTVRVVPNKYPVFEGGHEVIVHSPDHDRPLHAQPLAEVTDVVTMYQRRIAAQCAAGAAAVMVILNHGRAAGASLSHPHSQVFATPIVPPVLVSELEQFARYQVKYGRCLLCDVLRATLDEGSRVVFDGPLVAFTPEASRWPYELRLAPRAHAADFLQADPERRGRRPQARPGRARCGHRRRTAERLAAHHALRRPGRRARRRRRRRRPPALSLAPRVRPASDDPRRL